MAFLFQTFVDQEEIGHQQPKMDAGIESISCALTANDAAAANKLRVGKAQAQPFTFAPLDIGIEEGICAKHNLEIDATNFPGSANLRRGIAADATDVVVGSGLEVAFIVKSIANSPSQRWRTSRNRSFGAVETAAVELGMLPSEPDMSKLITGKFLPSGPSS
jgi:hypothetical protein